ncbi:MAG TPA: DUF4382 domain-containing protein [Gemmatimonadales bacterium]|nr:DUF4382 domain-containing protein [Gemmatimonadales bacterium]
MTTRWFGVASAALALTALAACDAGAPTSAPRLVPVSLYLTDAPGSPSLGSPPDAEGITVTGATVRISQAYLVPGGEGGERFVITDEPQDYDLFALQGGVRALLGTASIPEGEYAQLRLVVESAEVTLSDGSTHTLFVPSGMETGIKVTFPGTITVGGSATTVTVDFDVNANFRLLPPHQPERVLFTPLLVGTVSEG